MDIDPDSETWHERDLLGKSGHLRAKHTGNFRFEGTFTVADRLRGLEAKARLVPVSSFREMRTANWQNFRSTKPFLVADLMICRRANRRCAF
jgi:hypothetical protein